MKTRTLLARGGRRTFHFQYMLSSLEACIPELCASVVERVTYHPTRKADRPAHRGGTGTVHA
jgi:hypothetical protein